MIGGNEVTEVTSAAIKVRTASGAIQAFYRKPAIDYALAYRTRLKMAGDDAHKLEFQLRALEATVGLFRANNPGASLDEANAAVRAAINGART